LRASYADVIECQLSRKMLRPLSAQSASSMIDAPMSAFSCEFNWST